MKKGEDTKMPLFTYDCADCGFTKEILIYKDDKITCPNCGSENFTKRLSRPRIIMGCMRAPDEPSTPVTPDPNDDAPVMRIPQYADRKTGRNLGLGEPEFLVKKDK